MDKNLTKEQAESIIHTLAHMRLRPSMYFMGGLAGLKSWWDGFSVALGLFDISIAEHEYGISMKRGWKTNAFGAFPHMREKGLSENEMIVEYITIIIQAIQTYTKVGNEPILRLHKQMRAGFSHFVPSTEVIHTLEEKRVRYITELMDKIEADMLNS